MTPESILAEPARVLTQAQREFYFEQGYVVAEDFLKTPWLTRMRAAYPAVVFTGTG